MDALTFFKEQAKKANLTEVTIYVYDTVIASIMEEYAEVKLEEYKRTQELREFHEEDFGSPVGDHFSRED